VCVQESFGFLLQNLGLNVLYGYGFGGDGLCVTFWCAMDLCVKTVCVGGGVVCVYVKSCVCFLEDPQFQTILQHLPPLFLYTSVVMSCVSFCVVCIRKHSRQKRGGVKE